MAGWQNYTLGNSRFIHSYLGHIYIECYPLIFMSQNIFPNT